MRFEAEAPIAKRGVSWRLLALDLLLLLTAGFITGWQLRLLPVLVVVALAGYAFSGALRTPKKPDAELRKVAADEAGLSVDGKLVMPRAAIVSAHCTATDDDRHVVHVEGRLFRRSISVYVESIDKGIALMSALRIDPSRSTAHFRALPPWARHVRWLAVLLTASPWVLINVIRLLPGWTIGLLVGLYGVIVLPTVLPQRVDVGHDGIFTRWLGNKRFIPFSKIEGATLTPLGVKLILRGGRSLEIRLTQKQGEADTQARALLGHVNDGLAAHFGLARADEEAHLARGERDLTTWLRDMRALGSGERSGYRAAAIPRERLWGVVENPSADRSAREGAALALSASIDDEERERLLAVAQRTASPRLRVALSGVSREREETRLRIALETADREAEPEIDELDSSAMPAARTARAREPRS